jgi:predicted O-methyltransferase YrrM
MKNLFVPVAFVSLVLSTTWTMAQPGPGPRGPQRGAPLLEFEARTIPRNDREKRILEVIEDVESNQRRGSMSVPPNDGRLLRTLTEALDAKHVVELGTSVGHSGLWFALALESTGGKLVTFEIDEGRARMARENFKRAGVDDRITLIEGDAHENMSQVKGPVDLVFLDADKEGYVDYLEKLLPKLRPGGLVIAHNMNQRQADPRYVKAITTNPDLETVFVSAGASGISITLKKRGTDKS